MFNDIYISYLREYYEANGTINNIPYGYTVVYQGKTLKIYDFLKNIRNRHRSYIAQDNKMTGSSSKTSIERYKALDEMQIDWNLSSAKKVEDISDEDMIRYLRMHYKEYQTINNIPYNTEVEFEGKVLKIGSYLKTLRERHAKYVTGSKDKFCTSPISVERYKILDSMDFDWEPNKRLPKKKKENETCLKYLEEYYQTYGSIANITQKDIVEYEGKTLKIGQFLERTRVDYRKYISGNRTDGCASEVMLERYRILTAMDFVWEPNINRSSSTNPIDPHIDYLKWHYKEFGTINDITFRTVVEFNGMTLKIGDFLSKMRYSYKQYKTNSNPTRRYDTEVLLRRYQELEELKIDWNPKSKKTLKELAQEHNVSRSVLLKYNRQFFGDVEKALKFALLQKEKEKRKEKRKEHSLESVLEIFDVDFNVLVTHLNRKGLKTPTHQEKTLYYQGMTLREFCLKNGYNYDVIVKAVKLKSSNLCDEDIESLINRCLIEYNIRGQQQPSTWIYSKYGNEILVKHMILFLGFDSGSILHNMSSGAISLEEAISTECFHQQSKDKYNYLEEIYNDFINQYNKINTNEDLSEAESIAAIVGYAEELISEYHLTSEEYQVLTSAFHQYTTAIHRYHLLDVGFEKDPKVRIRKIINYKFDDDDIEEAFFIPLQFDEKVLIGRDSQMYKRRVILKNLTVSWSSLTSEEQTIKIKNHQLTEEELSYITSTRKSIDETKKLVKLHK